MKLTTYQACGKMKDKQISVGLILSKSLYKLDLTCMQREMNPGPDGVFHSSPV